MDGIFNEFFEKKKIMSPLILKHTRALIPWPLILPEPLAGFPTIEQKNHDLE